MLLRENNLKRRSVALLLSMALLAASFLAPFATPTAPVIAAPGQASEKVDEKAKIPEFVPGEILVRYRSDSIAKREERVAESLVSRGRQIPIDVERVDPGNLVEGLRMARVPAEDTLEAIAGLNARPDVLYAEPNFIRRKLARPNDPRYPEQWALNNTGQDGGTPGADIDAELAWDITKGSRSVVVGVIDEGIDINHPDLQANIWRNPGEVAGDGVDNDGNGFVDDINGWDFFRNDASVYDGSAGDNDTDSHGTHVSGTIGAVGNNNVGIVGVNWEVSLMSLKVLGSDGGSSAAILRAQSYAKMMRERGINIRALNNSYGGTGKSQAELDGIRALGSAGILYVAAAGNDSVDNDIFPHFPSNYDASNLVSVAATDRNDNLTSFSNVGGRTVITAAPGRSILSTTPNNRYLRFSGTSMATPHVTGAAALICAQFPSISVERLRGVLLFSGDDIPPLAGKVYSNRRLNVFKSLQSAAENDQTAPSSIGNLRVAEQNGRRVTLAFTAPGDDGNTGRAALYDVTIIDPTTQTETPLIALIPGTAGTSETISVNIPYRRLAGIIRIRTFDNVGNSSIATLNVTVSESASDPYISAVGGTSALSTGGTALGIVADDRYRENFPLPFSFPFYGQERSTLTVSTNGALYFSKPPKRSNGDADDLPSSVTALTAQTMIAGMWDDLRTDRRPGDDVYVVTPDSTRIIFRWQAVTYDDETPVNFEIELRRDGSIITRYGDGNTRLTPVVGISGGEPDAYVIETHTSETVRKSLTNAPTITFAPRGVKINELPTVTITRPANGASVPAGTIATLEAAASDPDGQVAKVEFFSGTFKIGEDTTAPFTLSADTSNVQPGVYQVHAVATDNSGAATRSQTITVTVTTGSGNAVPTVAITRPANNSSFPVGSSVTVEAVALDADGTIAKVEFFSGTVRLAEVTAAPFTFTAITAGIPPGTYPVHAVATDNRGATARSATIFVTLTSGQAVTTTLTFGELPDQVVNNLSVNGVTFNFQVDGAPSTDARYNSPDGPGDMTYIQGAHLEGDARGILTLTFAAPTPLLRFGLALLSNATLTPGANVQLFDASGSAIGTFPVNTSRQGFLFSEGEFNYRGTAVRRAVISFSAAVPRFTLDNLSFERPAGAITSTVMSWPDNSSADLKRWILR